MTISASNLVKISLVAPLSGWLLPIEQVPDPVFAEKMVGDGIAIDPTSNCLLAPCEGEVVQLHSAHHAITLRTDRGIEVLIHIELDTVELQGQGFRPQVQQGDRVKTGDRLIEFDADLIATHARSLLTEIVIANGDRITVSPHSGKVIAGQDVVLDLALPDSLPSVSGAATSASGAIATSLDGSVTSPPIVIADPTGLHARPAARLANLAKQYQSEIKLKRGDKQANIRSLVGVMQMEIAGGDTVYLVARGGDATKAIAALTQELQREMDSSVTAAPSVARPEADRSQSADPNTILGVAAAPGVAVGQLFQMQQQEIAVTENAADLHQEQQKLELAIAQAKREIDALRTNATGRFTASETQIFAAHLELLDDPELLKMAQEAMVRGKTAAFAWKQAYTTQAEAIAQLKAELLAARARDLRDVGRRVLRLLTSSTTESIHYPENAVLVAEDLTPSDVATLDPSVVGICTVAGGATSHVAILARSLDLPALVGVEPRLLDLPNGTSAILDGDRGVLHLNPAPEAIEQIRQQQGRLAAKRAADQAAAHQPAITTDGHRIEVVANLSSESEVERVIALGGEGVGLLRTEFVFLERSTAPTEEEQVAIYGNMARQLGDRPLIIRTLDVDGDKPLPYLPLPPQANPFLGERGIRLAGDRPDLFCTQLRAILRASQLGKVCVMFPMVARLEEWRMAKTMLEEERQQLGVEPIPAGIMVEVPAAALIAPALAPEVDFFSVGTNDLTQYTLAMDRGNPKLAPADDALHPAVRQLIAQTARAAQRSGKWLGIRGGIASDPQAVPLLIGLGVTELSVSIPAIPSIKARVRELNRTTCEQLAEQALEMATAGEVRLHLGGR
jgi:phosphocarrier protein FPr